MARAVVFDIKAREGLKRGMDVLADAVRVTLGPKGRNVVLRRKFGLPLVINDGVTIAKDIELEDRTRTSGHSCSARSRPRRTTSREMGQRPQRCSPRR